MRESKATHEQQLIEKVKAGDHQAMRSIYDLHIAYLMGVCTRYVCDREDAKDILQDSFIKIFQSIDSFSYKGEGSFRAWTTRIVVNESINFIRKHSKVSLLDPEVDVPDEEDETEIEEVPIAVIHRLISELPEGYRMVFNLFAIEGKSHKEIAQILGIKADSSASQYFRAKKLLATWINDYKQKHFLD